MRDMNKVLLYFSLKYNGRWKKIYKALDYKEPVSYEDLDIVESKLPEGVKYITVLSADYPECLKTMPRPPFVLFYKGYLADKDLSTPEKVFSEMKGHLHRAD